MSKGMILLFEDNRGIYIPRDFAQEVFHDLLQGYSWEDVETLKTIGNTNYEDLGPDDMQIYWDTWVEVLDNAYHIDEAGFIWKFHQDGDVWMYCPELMSFEEMANLFEDYDYEEEEDEEEDEE